MIMRKMLRLARAQRTLGVETKLVAGDATRQGVALARHFGFEPTVFAGHDVLEGARRQWCPDEDFAAWLQPLLRGADLVHAHMFGAWWAATVAAPAKGGVYVINRPSSVQTSLVMGSLAIKGDDPDRFAISVMNRILGGSPASRLFTNLREEKGYTYGAYSSVSSNRYPGVASASGAST